MNLGSRAVRKVEARLVRVNSTATRFQDGVVNG